MREGIDNFEDLGIVESDVFDVALLVCDDFKLFLKRLVLEVATLARLFSASTNSLFMNCWFVVVAWRPRWECMVLVICHIS